MDPLLSTEDVARHLGVPVATLYAWRTRGEGPRAYRVGKHLRYRSADVVAWLERQADPAPASPAA